MSSACVCHLKVPCFYCEVYSPMYDEYVLLQMQVKHQEGEIEKLKAYRDEWAKRAGQSGALFTEAMQEIERLNTHKAALLECLKEIARPSTNHDTTTLKMLARESLDQVGEKI